MMRPARTRCDSPVCVTNEGVEVLSRDEITGHSYLPAECPRTTRLLYHYGEPVKPRRRPPLAPLAPHQPRSARDAAHAIEYGAVVRHPRRVQEGARGAERDPPGGVVQLIRVSERC